MGRFCKRVVLANVPSFRFLVFVPSFQCLVLSFCCLYPRYPRYGFGGPGNIRQNHPSGNPVLPTPETHEHNMLGCRWGRKIAYLASIPHKLNIRKRMSRELILNFLTRITLLQARSRSYRPKVRVTAWEIPRIRTKLPRQGTRGASTENPLKAFLDPPYVFVPNGI